MPRYKIFDPKSETTEAIRQKLEKSNDLVAICELTLYLRKHPQAERQITVLSYCLSTALQVLDNVKIAQASVEDSHTEQYEARLFEIEEKLSRLKENPKETKTYQILLVSLERQREEFARLVEFGDVPKTAQKDLATLDLMLRRINQCLMALAAEGVKYHHLETVFPRIKKLVEDA